MAQMRGLRVGFMMAIVTALTLILGYRLFYWQVLHQEEILARAKKPLPAQPVAQPRGTIRDRNGYLLATDTVAYKFAVSPQIVSYPERTAQTVSEITGIPAEELLEIFLRDDQYYLIAETVPYTVGQQLVVIDDPAFIIEPVVSRAYRPSHQPVTGTI
jgi:cell division protein FtsI/penicillin-binding protein 2